MPSEIRIRRGRERWDKSLARLLVGFLFGLFGFASLFAYGQAALPRPGTPSRWAFMPARSLLVVLVGVDQLVTAFRPLRDDQFRRALEQSWVRLLACLAAILLAGAGAAGGVLL